MWLRAACCVVALAACGPKAALVSSLLPDGTTSILLSHLEREEEGNRRRIAELEARKDWDGLVKFAEENLARDRNSSSWWLVAGYAHSQAGRMPRAIECFSEVVRLAPDEMLGWSLLAQAYRDAKQPLRAIQTLDNAHLMYQGTPGTWYMLGLSYSDLDRDLPAASAYQAAIKMKPDFAQAWFGLGRSYARLNRRAGYEKALASLQRLDPELAKQLAELRPGPR
jgi:tetratricopeptide (TPR) repeat protein